MPRIVLDLPTDMPDGPLWIHLERPLAPEGAAEVEIRDTLGGYSRTVMARIERVPRRSASGPLSSETTIPGGVRGV